MRYTLINGLLLLAISPFTALALPVDPSDQGGPWDPSGQYRKGHYDLNGHFIPNDGSNQVGWNENGQNYQNGQNSQNGHYENGQWRGNDWNQNIDWNRNDQNKNHWQRRSLPLQSLNAEELREYGNPGADHPHVSAPGLNIPGTGIHSRNWPNDQNNNQDGWTDAKGVWHQNNQNGQNTQNGAGWTDAKGVWHSTDYSHGWTDANGVWHANQKREIVPGVGAPATGIYNHDHPTVVNDAADTSSIIHVPRYYPNDDRYDNYREQEEANRHQEHEEDRETPEDVTSVLLPGSVVARNDPHDQSNWKNNGKDNNDWSHNVPQANPVASYNDEADDDDHHDKNHHDKNHHEDKDINATGEKLE